MTRLIADIGGQLSCRGATLHNEDGDALNADRATVKGDVFLDEGFSATGEVHLASVRAGSVDQSTFPSADSMRRMRYGVTRNPPFENGA